MTEWKQRGCVEDSDDEGQSSISESQDTHVVLEHASIISGTEQGATVGGSEKQSVVSEVQQVTATNPTSGAVDTLSVAPEKSTWLEENNEAAPDTTSQDSGDDQLYDGQGGRAAKRLKTYGKKLQITPEAPSRVYKTHANVCSISNGEPQASQEPSLNVNVTTIRNDSASSQGVRDQEPAAEEMFNVLLLNSSSSDSLPDVDTILRAGNAIDSAQGHSINVERDPYHMPSSSLSDAPSHESGSQDPSVARNAALPSQTSVSSSRQHDDHRISLCSAAGRHSSELDIDMTGWAIRAESNLLVNQAEAPSGRAFRARKAIQLHPYLLEGEQYRMTLKARGLRPVHVLTSTQSKAATEAETQDFFAENNESQTISQDMDSSLTRSISPLPVQEQLTCSAPAEIALSVLSTVSDDELPDLDAVLHQNPDEGARDGRKRRKLGQTVCPSPAFSVDACRVSASVSHAIQVPLTDDTFNMPPSPPPTSSTSPPPQQVARFEQERFRLPRGFSPSPLPTPLASSALRPSLRQNAVLLSGYEPGLSGKARPAFSAADTIDSSSESSSTESEVDESQLCRAQRRIKGVLPASWLRLDKQAQAKRASLTRPQYPRRMSESCPPGRVEFEKGVARRISSNSHSMKASHENTDVNQRITVLSDSGDSDDQPLQTQYEVRHSRRSNSSTPCGKSPARNTRQSQPVDVVEDDWVDPMFSSTSRRPVGVKKGKKRQLRLPDVLVSDALSNPYTAGPIPLVRATTRSKEPRKSEKRTNARKGPTVPRLSILDAPDSPTLQVSETPQFVRLAVRHARQQKDYGRHSPRHKIIRLHTYEDTIAALKPLHDWRRANLKPVNVQDHKSRSGGLGEKGAGSSHIPPPPRPQSPQRLADSQQRQPPPQLESEATLLRARTPCLKVIRSNGSRLQQARLRPTVRAALPATVGNATKVPSPRSWHDRPQQKQSHVRSAQIESLESEFYRVHRKSAFQRRLQEIHRMPLPPDLAATCTTPRPASKSAARQGAKDNFQISRFMRDDDAPIDSCGSELTDAETNKPGSVLRSRVLPRRPRKQPAHRVDAEARQYRQPSELALVDGNISISSEPTAQPTLCGLGPFGIRYPTNFDVRPLELGTYFHQSTFIGSGDFADSLDFRGRDLDISAGIITIQAGHESFRWSAWDEEVASGLPTIADILRQSLLGIAQQTGNRETEDVIASVEPTVLYLLRSLVRYCSGCIYFLDPIDRQQCVARFIQLLEELHDTITSSAEALVSDRSPACATRLILKCRVYSLALARQMLQIARHSSIQSVTRNQAEQLFHSGAALMVNDVVQNHVNDVRTFLENNRRHAIRDPGIQDNQPAVECVVVTYHVLCSVHFPGYTFWDAVNDALNSKVNATCDVRSFDRIWYDIFAILPLLEIDSRGIFRPGRRFQQPDGGWILVRSLVGRVLTLHPETPRTQDATLNEYLRATFERCHNLLTQWGWARCESILTTIFDFFARRGLSPLSNEESRGTPLFLENLQAPYTQTINVEPYDCALHIFLKMLAVGLLGLRSLQGYTDRKIQSVAWRFIPNHGRTYPKDEAIRQVDLSALRNHHDLLCTLYWVSPPGYRPRVDLLRNLVDHARSHREACRLNVHAWARLAKFQATTDEDPAMLVPFAQWFEDIWQTTMAQYRLARSEAEVQYETARLQGTTTISAQMLQATITSNQRQVLATLLDATVAMKEAIKAARGSLAAQTLVEKSAVLEILKIFGDNQSRLHGVIVGALHVLCEYLQLCERLNERASSQTTSEESQDYGDWSGLEEVISSAEPTTCTATSASFLHVVSSAVFDLASSCFGAETAPEDTLLTAVVDTWTSLAAYQVKRGASWPIFTDSFSSTSWHQLRDTEQTRKFTPYCLSLLVDASGGRLMDDSSSVLLMWIVSTLERESLLKHQHRLTTSLLNSTTSKGSLFANLPFAVDPGTGRYNITLSQLRERRLSLISSIFCNMRQSLENTIHGAADTLVETRRNYAEILRQLMNAMKRNYQDLTAAAAASGHTSTLNSEAVASTNVTGAYVSFVQRVVELLQQYTTDIVPIDRFFTDSAAFPLPATDPTYVVGRLKGYGLKLDDARTRKQLVVFVQTVSERAALDHQQDYLAHQLSAAVVETLKSGRAEAPRLGMLLMSTIFPAYVEVSFGTEGGWILANPILKATEMILADLIYTVDTTEPENTDRLVTMITLYLQDLRSLVEMLVQDEVRLACKHSIRTLTNTFVTVKMSLTLVDYLFRSEGRGTDVLKVIEVFYLLGKRLNSMLSCDQYDTTMVDDLQPETDVESIMQPNPDPDLYDFVKKELTESLSSGWRRHGEEWYLIRGGIRREITVELGGLSDGKERLRAATEAFCLAAESMPALRLSRSRIPTPESNVLLEGVIV
ncbi:hypothetical protein LTR66_002445 [Elasticomyces elasticus]|nr:hypothetical protein LTR66_002445 [Elasticomyces elasticus]